MDPLETADLIDKAHDELLARGWNRGEYESEDGRVCALGAISHASGVHPLNTYTLEPARSASEALGITAGAVFGVATWNDAEGRTEDEVFDAFRQTSKRLREAAGNA